MKSRRKEKAAPQHQPPSPSGVAQFEPHAHAAILAYLFQPVPKYAPIASMHKEIERLSALSDKEKRVLIEDILMGQAHSLQAMFTWLATRVESSQLIDHMQVYGHLALKAQRQCRATLATLAEIRNPGRATFIKNTAGHQQINVGAAGQSPASEKLSQNLPNELLKALPHATLDEDRACCPIPTDTQMETVDPLNRSHHARGQAEGRSKRTKARAIRR